MSVRLASVGHRFTGGSWLFRDLDLVLEKGEMWSLTGPSGSGKSTLLGILAGWVAPSEGRVTRDPDLGVTWVAQNPFGVAPRTAMDHVTLALLAQGWTRAEAEPVAAAALNRFGLSGVARRPFGQLSGGEAQRLMLARATVTEAELVLVDEPTAQLDPSTAAIVIDTLGGLPARGHIAVVATHDPRVAASCTHQIDLARAS